MKYCSNCGKELNDEAFACIYCGCKCASTTEKITKKFCTKCGAEVNPEAVICVKCGCRIEGSNIGGFSGDDKLTTLSNRERINGIIWICIAAIQIIIGLCGTWLPLIVGVLNIITAVQSINYSNEVLQNHNGIIKRYEPLTGPVVTLIYNLLIGVVIGVAGSIYYLVAIRNFVMENREYFESIDESI